MTTAIIVATRSVTYTVLASNQQDKRERRGDMRVVYAPCYETMLIEMYIIFLTLL